MVDNSIDKVKASREATPGLPDNADNTEEVQYQTQRFIKSSEGLYKTEGINEYEFVSSNGTYVRREVYNGNDAFRSKEDLVNYLYKANQQKDLKTVKEREKIGKILEVQDCTFTPAIIPKKLTSIDEEEPK